MPLNPGTRIGVYEVTAKIGEGGMGEVYQARDTSLDRDVALKVLPEAFMVDPERLTRFQREAKVLASLNHPNIGAIHGIEAAGDTQALVLELIEGPTLADRIAEGAIPVDEALMLAKQIADALEVAHEQGIIHRDLKPANVKVKADGTVKVLDFGLAKAATAQASETGGAESPTMSITGATQMGMVIGTAAYMAPEQAKGKPVDKRADIWAFGVVLLEMLTGRRVFDGETASETLAAVMMKEPDWDRLPAGLPPNLNNLVRRCLEREPRERVRDIGDARLAMHGAFETTIRVASGPTAVASTPIWQRPMAIAVAVLASLVVGGGAAWNFSRQGPVSSGLMRFAISPPETAPLDFTSLDRDLVISPDGTQIVYNGVLDGGPRLNILAIDQFEGVPLRGGETGSGAFFSPDSEWVGFVTRGGTQLQKVLISGGPPVALAESPARILGASWSLDDQIVFGTQAAGLYRVSGGGGVPEELTTLDSDRAEVNHTWPFVIPGRGVVLFVISTESSVSNGQLAVLDLDTREVTDLGLRGTSPHYVSTGHVVYMAEDASVRAVPFDVSSLEVTGNPVPVVEDVVVKPSSGAANFSVSEQGRLVYGTGAGGGGAPRTLVWVDREGREELLGEAWPDDQYSYPRMSPDGESVAVGIAENTDNVTSPADLWVLDLARGSRSRITFGGNNRFLPTWSPDGAQLAFADTPFRPNRILAASADGSGLGETLLDREGQRVFPTSWSPDGQTLAFYEDYPETGRDIYVVRIAEDSAPVPFVATPFQERAAAFSPDGRWLVYVSNESGRDEVYVRPYPGPGREITISTTGGEEPVWAPDGRELFYRNQQDQMLAVSVDISGQEFQAGSPEQLFEGLYDFDPAGTSRASSDALVAAGGGGSPNYAVAADGQRFLMIKQSGAFAEGRRPEIKVVLDWFEELNARVPVP